MGCGQSTDTSRDHGQPSPQTHTASVDTAAAKQAEEAVSAVSRPAEKAAAEAAPAKQAEEETSITRAFASRRILGEEDGDRGQPCGFTETLYPKTHMPL